MSEFSEARTSVASQIFASYFREKVDEPTLRRMVAVFEDVASYNERGIAIQFNAALAAGKLEEVTVAYEELADPETGFLHLVPDPMTRAVEVRRYQDVVYVAVFAGGDPQRLFDIEPPEIPEVFDLMTPQNPELN